MAISNKCTNKGEVPEQNGNTPKENPSSDSLKVNDEMSSCILLFPEAKYSYFTAVKILLEKEKEWKISEKIIESNLKR